MSGHRHRHLGSIFLSAVIFILGFSVCLATPAVPLDYGAYPHLAAVYQQEGQNNALVGMSVFGRDLFVFANENTGLHTGEIVDGEPALIGQVDLPGVEIDFAVKDWTLWVLKNSGSVQAVSMGSPEAPLAGNSFDLPGEPSSMIVEGDRLYIACGSAGLQVFDIVGPGYLAFAASWSSNVTSVTADGFRLGVIRDGRLELLDFTDPAAPVFLGDSDLAGIQGAREAVLHGDIAWVCAFDGVHQLDISQPSAMTKTYTSNGRGQLYRDGTDLMIAQTGGGVINSILFLDFATGQLGQSIGWFQEKTSAAVVAGHVIGAAYDVVAVYRDGLHEFPVPQDIWTDDYHFNPVGFCAPDVAVFFEQYPETGLAAREIGGNGSFLWQHALDLAPAEHLRDYASSGSLAAILSSDGADWGSACRVRLGTVTPQGVIDRGVLPLPDMAWLPEARLAFLDQQTLLVLEPYNPNNGDTTSLRVIDITDPDLPILLDRVMLGLTQAADLEVDDNLVLVTFGHSCEIVDATDRANLQPTGVHNFGGRAILDGTRVFVSNDYNVTGPYSLDTWDFSDPANPILISVLPMIWVGQLYSGDGWAIQAGTGTLFDLTAAGGATPVGNAGPRNWHSAFFLTNEEFMAFYDPYSEALNRFLFLPAPHAQGLVAPVGDRPPVVGPQISAAPNPFNPRTTIRYTVPQAADVEIAVYDLAGKRVTTLWRGVRSAGQHEVAWQGRDESDRAVAAGVYFVRVSAGDSWATEKVTLVK